MAQTLAQCNTNADYLEFAYRNMRTLVQLEREYEAAKLRTVDGRDVTIPNATITAMKQKGAAIRTDIITALNSLTA